MNIIYDNLYSSLRKKCVFVTGAGGGIGSVIAEQFAKAGADLALSDLPVKLALLTQECERLSATYNIKATGYEMDITQISEIQDIVKKILLEHDCIDVLINNAGVNTLVPATQVTSLQWDTIMNINLKGSFFVTQEVAKNMIIRESGSIINIASQHGVVGNFDRAPYCASKGGLISLTRALAVEWARYGIRVNAISPTFVLSDKNEEILNNYHFKRANLTKIPIGRYAEPKDVAHAALFLAMSESAMITGHNLLVDGGWTIA